MKKPPRPAPFHRRRSPAPRRWGAIPFLVVAAASLVGCADAVTVHPTYRYSLDEQEHELQVPNVAGRWVARELDAAGAVDDANDDDAVAITIAGDPALRGVVCPSASVQIEDSSGTTDVGTLNCFVELGGYLLAELQSPEPLVLYRQYLVRPGDESFEICGPAPAVLQLYMLEQEQPSGIAMDTLQYTIRSQEFYTLMVVISERDELRNFLAAYLPSLAAACDTAEAGHYEEDLYVWRRFERVPPATEGEEAVE
jgi:hypothetical protein